MNFLQRHVTVERLVRAARTGTDAEARRAVSEIVEEERRDASREYRVLLGALVAQAGGRVEVPAALLTEIGPDGVLEVTGHSDGRLELRGIQVPPELAALVQHATEQGQTVLSLGKHTPPATDYPAANLEEPENVARVRVLEAIRTLIQRHYDGEMRARGFDFMVTVAGELLAMALGTKLAQIEGDVDTALVAFGEEFRSRVQHYTDVVTQQQQEPDPGDPPPPATPPNRIM